MRSIRLALLLVGSLLISLLLAEFALRLVPPEKLNFSGKNNVVQSHERLVYDWNAKLPGVQVVSGVAFPSPPVDRPKRRFRILVLGDSFSAGVPNFPSWPNFMRRLIRRAGAEDHLEIVNTSVSGYTAWQECTMLKLVGPTLHPDLVVDAWVPNDGTEEFMFVDDGRSILYPWSFQALHAGRRIGFVRIFLARYSRLYQIWLQRFARRFSQHNAEDVIIPTFNLFSRFGAEKQPRAFEHHLSILREMRLVGEGYGARFRRIYFGLMPQNYPFVCANNRDFPGECDFLSSYGPQKRLMTALGEPDALNVMAGLGKPLHPSLIWSDGGHFAWTGALLVSALVLDWLSPALPLTEGEAVRIREEIDSVRRVEDAINRPLCGQSFRMSAGLRPYHSPDLVQEPPTFQLPEGTALRLSCSQEGGKEFSRGFEYYFSLDGYPEGPIPPLWVRQNGHEVGTFTAEKFFAREFPKTIPITWVFTVKERSREIELELPAIPANRWIVRSWTISGCPVDWLDRYKDLAS